MSVSDIFNFPCFVMLGSCLQLASVILAAICLVCMENFPPPNSVPLTLGFRGSYYFVGGTIVVAQATDRGGLGREMEQHPGCWQHVALAGGAARPARTPRRRELAGGSHQQPPTHAYCLRLKRRA